MIVTLAFSHVSVYNRLDTTHTDDERFICQRFLRIIIVVVVLVPHLVCHFPLSLNCYLIKTRDSLNI